ncbi:MAG TPA: hypothetical protein VLF21_00570 [Candidatus Saccharimonadales bacterium]|nr:hypothetical protein [Candidatus Saccharimonadales bacterium]
MSESKRAHSGRTISFLFRSRRKENSDRGMLEINRKTSVLVTVTNVDDEQARVTVRTTVNDHGGPLDQTGFIAPRTMPRSEVHAFVSGVAALSLAFTGREPEVKT